MNDLLKQARKEKIDMETCLTPILALDGYTVYIDFNCTTTDDEFECGVREDGNYISWTDKCIDISGVSVEVRDEDDKVVKVDSETISELEQICKDKLEEELS